MKKLLMLLVIVLAGVTLLAYHVPKAAAFDPFGKLKDKVCNQSPDANANSSACNTSGTKDPVSGTNGVIIKGTNLIAMLGGVAGVVMVIIGGLQYILSTGDSARTNSAKNTILYAVIGLVVIVVARTIIVFVLNKIE